MFDLIVVSAALSVALAVAWPKSERDQAAVAFAHSYCAIRPQPAACAPDGHPADAVKPWLGLATPPAGSPGR